MQILRKKIVQGTNDNSIVSKWSMSQAGYFNDEFLQHFIGKQARRSPLINRGYYVRAKAVEYVFEHFLNYGKRQTGERHQIISLGAGFDSSYFRLKSEGRLANCVYIEVDFPAVVKRKHSLIRQSSQLLSIIGQHEPMTVAENSPVNIELQTEDYVLLGVDLTQLDTLTACLTHVGFDTSALTLVLSEVVLTYMPPKLADSVIAWASTFPNAVFAAYEQLYPTDAFGQVMVQHFNKLGSPLRCIDLYPSISDQVRRYVRQGWECCEAVDMNHFYHSYLDDGERRRVELLEPFDEPEEWHLKCAHYTLICAFTKQSEALRSRMWSGPGRAAEGVSAGSNDRTHGQGDARTVSAVEAEEIEQHTAGKVQSLLGVWHAPVQILRGKSGEVCVMGQSNGAFCSSVAETERCDPKTHVNVTDNVCTCHRFAAECDRTRVNSTPASLESGFHNQYPCMDNHPTCAEKPIGVTLQSVSENLTLNTRDSVKRFGHAVCVVDAENILVIGGFGEKDSKHRRLGEVTCVNLTNGECSIVKCRRSHDKRETSPAGGEEVGQGGRGSTSADCNSMESFQHSSVVSLDLLYHSATLLSNQQVLIFGGRRSPLKPNSEIMVLKKCHTTEEAAEMPAQDTNETFAASVETCSYNGCSQANVSQTFDKDVISASPGEEINVSTVTAKSGNEETGQGQEKGQDNVMYELSCWPVDRAELCRWRHSACCLKINGKEYVVIYGGRSVTGGALADCFVLDTAAWEWSEVQFTENVIGPLHSHAASAWNSACVISGGLDDQQVPSNHIYLLSVTTATEQPAAGCMSRLQLQREIHARYSHSSVVVGDSLFMLGGVRFHVSPPELTAVHLHSGAVSEYVIEVAHIEQPVMLHGHGSARTAGGEVIIVGGGGNCFSFGTHLNHQLYKLKLPVVDYDIQSIY